MQCQRNSAMERERERERELEREREERELVYKAMYNI
jgi:hypothetical protein